MTDVTSIYLELDMPPGVNNLFLNLPGRGRVKAPKYAAWINAAGWQLQAQAGPKRVPGPVSLTINLVKQNKRRVDLDGKIKAVADLLVSHNVIDDDSLVQSISASWVSSGAPAQVTVTSAGKAE